MSNRIGAGPSGGQALQSQAYTIKSLYFSVPAGQTTTTITHITGCQRIIFRYLNFTWSFSIQGGTNRPCASTLEGTQTYQPSNNYSMGAEEPFRCVFITGTIF